MTQQESGYDFNNLSKDAVSSTDLPSLQKPHSPTHTRRNLVIAGGTLLTVTALAGCNAVSSTATTENPKATATPETQAQLLNEAFSSMQTLERAALYDGSTNDTHLQAEHDALNKLMDQGMQQWQTSNGNGITDPDRDPNYNTNPGYFLHGFVVESTTTDGHVIYKFIGRQQNPTDPTQKNWYVLTLDQDKLDSFANVVTVLPGHLANDEGGSYSGGAVGPNSKFNINQYAGYVVGVELYEEVPPNVAYYANHGVPSEQREQAEIQSHLAANKAVIDAIKNLSTNPNPNVTGLTTQFDQAGSDIITNITPAGLPGHVFSVIPNSTGQTHISFGNS